MKIPIYNGDEQPEAAPEPRSASEVPEGASNAMADTVVPPATEESVPADVQIQALEAALAEKTQESEATREQLLRLMADFDNYRKRTTRQHD
jgi:molecular chaperone GrpE (heat shock protein)